VINMIVDRKQEIAIGSRRIKKKFALHKTIKIGGINGSPREYITLVCQSYYELEEYSHTNFGKHWMPIATALAEDDFKSYPPYESFTDRMLRHAKERKETEANEAKIKHEELKLDTPDGKLGDVLVKLAACAILKLAEKSKKESV